MVYPSLNPDKRNLSIAQIFQAIVVQLTDFFGREKVIGEAHPFSVALLDAIQPLDADKRFEHVSIE